MASNGADNGKALTPHRRRPHSDYTDAEIERGLQAVVLASGNTRRASALTAQQGERVPRSTLRRWANVDYIEWYERIRRDLEPQLYDRLAEGFEELAQTYIELQQKAAEQLRKRLPDASIPETSTIAYRAGIGAGIAVDKAIPMRVPREIREPRDLAAVLRALKQKHPSVVVVSEQGEEYIEASAQELPSGDEEPPDQAA